LLFSLDANKTLSAFHENDRMAFMPRVAIIASLATVVPFQLMPENHLKYIMKKSLLNKSLKLTTPA